MCTCFGLLYFGKLASIAIKYPSLFLLIFLFSEIYFFSCQQSLSVFLLMDCMVCLFPSFYFSMSLSSRFKWGFFCRSHILLCVFFILEALCFGWNVDYYLCLNLSPRYIFLFVPSLPYFYFPLFLLSFGFTIYAHIFTTLPTLLADKLYFLFYHFESALYNTQHTLTKGPMEITLCRFVYHVQFSERLTSTCLLLLVLFCYCHILFLIFKPIIHVYISL